MKTSFFVKSSSGGSYEIVLDRTTGRLRVFCNCQAGIQGQICKHKIGLIAGDAALLSDETQTSLLTHWLEFPETTELRALVKSYQLEIAEIEKSVSALKAREKKLKSTLAATFAG